MAKPTKHALLRSAFIWRNSSIFPMLQVAQRMYPHVHSVFHMRQQTFSSCHTGVRKAELWSTSQSVIKKCLNQVFCFASKITRKPPYVFQLPIVRWLMDRNDHLINGLSLTTRVYFWTQFINSWSKKSHPATWHCHWNRTGLRLTHESSRLMIFLLTRAA